ncbi:SDR family oxidoreductase [Leucobacter sp.]
MLAGRTYVLTGGAAGIGLATAHLLLDHGARLIVIDRSEIPADLAVRGPTVLRVDLTDTAAMESLIARIVADQPRLSGIIASAGLTTIAAFEDTPALAWDLLIRTNLIATIRLVHGLLPALELEADLSGAADVIVLGSVPDESGFRGATVFGTGSAATRAFASHLRAELGPRGVRTAHLSTGYARAGLRDRTGETGADRGGPEDGHMLPEDYATVIACILRQPAGTVVDEITLVATAQGWA